MTISVRRATARAGWFFPVGVAQIKWLLRTNGLDNTKLLVTFRNPPAREEDGRLVLDVVLPRRLVLYSLPEEVTRETALLTIAAAWPQVLRLLSGDVTWKHETQYRVTVTGDGKMWNLVHRQISYQLGKYRSAQKFSSAFKPRKQTVVEMIIDTRKVRATELGRNLLRRLERPGN